MQLTKTKTKVKGEIEAGDEWVVLNYLIVQQINVYLSNYRKYSEEDNKNLDISKVWLEL